jgi:hypothetical protein
MLSLKTLIIIGCVYINQAIRLVVVDYYGGDAPKPDCILCKVVIGQLIHQLALNSTDTLIAKEINELCHSNEYCEVAMPMIVNKIIQSIDTHGDSVCTPFC